MGFFTKRPPPGPYKTGDAVPRDGVVQCTQYGGTRAKVREGARFARCLHWNSDHHGRRCTWAYVEALEKTWVERRAGYSALRVHGLVELWAGWQLTLPSECVAERHADGSWLAWDTAHVVDVRIVRTRAKRVGRSNVARTMLDRQPNTAGDGWAGYAEDRSLSDADGPLHRLELVAAANDTLMSCSVSYREPERRIWAERLVNSISYTRPS